MKKLLSILLAASMILTFAACGAAPATPSASTPAPAPAPAPETSAAAPAPAAPAPETFTPVSLKVAYMPNMGSASLLATAQEKGYFKDLGLTVELVQFQGGPAEISAMASGDIQISQIGHGAHALCAEGQAVIFQMDCTSLADAVVANKSKGINTVADLKGKKIASTAGTSAEIILNLALEKAGLTQKDVEIVEMDANGIVTAMISGGVDACATWSPGTMTIAKALGDKAITLASNNDFLDKVTFPSSFVTNQKYADANREVLVRFARALQKAADYRAANIDEVAKLVAKLCEADEATMLACTGEGNWIPGEFYKTGVSDGTVKGYYENQQKVFISGGRLKEAVDVNKYVMFDIMQEAYAANHK